VAAGGGCFNHGTWAQTQQLFLRTQEPVEVVVVLTQQDPKFHAEQAAPLHAVGLAVVQHDFDDKALDAG
jgi:hypothetical protein